MNRRRTKPISSIVTGRLSDLQLAVDLSRPSEAVVAAQNPSGFVTLVNEDYIANVRDWTRPAFARASVPLRRVANERATTILRAPLSVLYRIMHRCGAQSIGIELHYTAKIAGGSRSATRARSSSTSTATIGDELHDIRRDHRRRGRVRDRRAPTLGNNVMVGAGAVSWVGAHRDRRRIGPTRGNDGRLGGGCGRDGGGAAGAVNRAAKKKAENHRRHRDTERKTKPR